MSSASKSSADRRARSTDPTRSAAWCRSSRAAAARRRRRRRSKPAAATCCAAAGATTGEVNGVRWQLGANYFEDAGFTGTGRATARPCRTTMRRSGRRRRSIGWRHAASGADLQGSFQYVDTERGSPGPVRIGSGAIASPASTASRAARPSASAAALRVDAAVVRRRRAASASASSSTPPTTTSSFKSAVRRARTATRIARTRACRPTSRRTRRSGSPAASSGSASAAAARSSPSGRPGAMPVERGVLGIFGEARWNASDRATRHRRRSRRAHHRATRLPGDPLAFHAAAGLP